MALASCSASLVPPMCATQVSREVSLGERSRTGFIRVWATWLSGAISENYRFLANSCFRRWEPCTSDTLHDLIKTWLRVSARCDFSYRIYNGFARHVLCSKVPLGWNAHFSNVFSPLCAGMHIFPMLFVYLTHLMGGNLQGFT